MKLRDGQVDLPWTKFDRLGSCFFTALREWPSSEKQAIEVDAASQTFDIFLDYCEKPASFDFDVLSPERLQSYQIFAEKYCLPIPTRQPAPPDTSRNELAQKLLTNVLHPYPSSHAAAVHQGFGKEFSEYLKGGPRPVLPFLLNLNSNALYNNANLELVPIEVLDMIYGHMPRAPAHRSHAVPYEDRSYYSGVDLPSLVPANVSKNFRTAEASGLKWCFRDEKRWKNDRYCTKIKRGWFNDLIAYYLNQGPSPGPMHSSSFIVAEPLDEENILIPDNARKFLYSIHSGEHSTTQGGSRSFARTDPAYDLILNLGPTPNT